MVIATIFFYILKRVGVISARITLHVIFYGVLTIKGICSLFLLNIVIPFFYVKIN